MPSGDYNITVHVDFRNNVFEFLHDDNNQLSTSVKIQQALPDLRVNNLTVSVTDEFNATRLDAVWSVENIGSGKTLELNWLDTLYIKRSNSNFFDVLGEYEVTNELPIEKGQRYTNNATVFLPLAVFGQVSVMVEAASEQLSGDTSRTNNFYTLHLINIDLRAADMVIQNDLKLSDNIQGGKEVEVQYTVFNRGNKNIINTYWVDRIFIKKYQEDVNPFRNIEVKMELNETLNINDSYSKTINLKLPDDMSGAFFLEVDVNSDNSIFEGDKLLNNRIVELINVEISPAADLAVQSLTVTDKGEVSGERILSVTWEVKNIGNSMSTLKMWTDRIFAQIGPLNNNRTTDLGTFMVENRLLSQASYVLERNVILPLKLSGSIYICVQTDTTLSVYESHSTNNNIKCMDTPLHVEPRQGARLIGRISNVSTASQSGIVAVGSKMTIECNILNVGDLTTKKSSWMDVIYIAETQVSTTTQLRNVGLRIKDVLHVGILLPNMDYNFSSTFTIPQGFSGHPKFYVIPDDINEPGMGSTDNTGTNAGSTSTAVESVTSYLPKEQISFILPNLVINSSTVLHKMEGGQPVTLDYNVTNTGNITTFQVWYDSVYLSDDFLIDAFDLKLKSEPRPLQIDAGETIPFNISFILPLDLATKSYFLAVVCDSRNDVFEENEDDNTLRLSFDMQAKASTDLFVKRVIAPESAEYGSTMSVTWEVANNGTKPARGYKCDSVYLSDDSEWDINDHQLGRPSCVSFQLDGNQTEIAHGAVNSATPHAKAQKYLTLVKTRSNIIDVLSDNNVGVADKTTEITYQLLEFDQLKQVHLEHYGSVALRIKKVTEDKTIVINVTSDNQEAFNTAYIKVGRPATLYDFDQTSENPSSANHILTVPDTLNEDYYVLVENAGYLSTGSGIQTLDISVKYAKFEVMSVSPETLLLGSQTTVHISGTLFPFDMQAELHFNDSTISPIAAKSTRVFSSTDAYATFYIPSDIHLKTSFVSLKYNAERDSKVTGKMLRFRTGAEGFLSTSVENLGRFRAGETALISVHLQNNGDSDLLAPIFTVQAVGGGTIRLMDSSKVEIYKHQYLMIGTSKKGPAGIFLPRSQGSIRFEAKPKVATESSSMQFKVSSLQVSNQIPNPYIDLKEEMRPSHYDQIQWEKVWTNFIKLTGNSTLSLSRKVSEVISDMSLAGRRVQKFEDITNFLLELADAPYGDRIILRETVFNAATDSAVVLAVDFTLSARIGSREQDGFLGKGWILPLW